MDIQRETINLNSKKVSELLLAGADVNTAGGEYGSAIQAAGQLGRDAILDILLKNHADINTRNVGKRNPHGRTALSLAAESGHVSVVRQLLAWDGIKVDLDDDNGRTPLSWAAGSGESFSIIVELLGRSAADAESKDINGRTPLSWAAGNGQERVVQFLLKRPDFYPDTSDKNGRTPLSWAAGNGHHVAVDLLLERDDVSFDHPDRGGRTPLSWAAEAGEVSVMKILLGKHEVDPDCEDKNGMTPLSWAAEKGKKDAVYLLLSRADVNHNSTSSESAPPLWRAAMNGHDGTVEVLLAADNIDINHRDKYGKTLLSWAAETGHAKIVKLLLSTEGLSPDSPDKVGRTALSKAAEAGRSAIVEILLKRNDVNPDSVDDENRTPLIWAAMKGHITVVELLLAKEGVNPDSKDNSGRTALLWALEMHHDHVVRPLIHRDTISLHSLVQEGSRQSAAILISAGYDVDRSDSSGTTALRLAIRNKDHKTVELLLKNGAGTRGVVAGEWLDVYGRARTDIVQLLQGADGQKHISFIESGSLANLPTLSVQERRLLVIPIELNKPGEPFSIKKHDISPNKFRVYYEKVDNHATKIHVSLSFPVGEGSLLQPQYIIPRSPSSYITWTIICPPNPHIRPWRSVDHYSMMPIGWIPDDGNDFFRQIILHLEERWTRVCDTADEHLKLSRLDQLRSEGKNPDLMRQLARDAQKWTELRAILQDHITVAQNFIMTYSMRYNANQFPTDLQNTVNEFKAKITRRLDQLDQTIRDLLQFEFAWASINESRISTRLGHNVMLFTYVSIFYLPLAFCASIWAIPNITDSGTRNPFIITSVIVGFITLCISFNLENITTLGWRLYQGWRAKVVKDMQIVDDDHWRERGYRLESANNPNSSFSSEWWLVGYWFWKLDAMVRGLLSKRGRP